MQQVCATIPGQEESVVWMRAFGVSLLLLSSACTAGDAATTTTEQASPIATDATTTTAGPTSTTTEAPQDPTTTVRGDQVGSREVMLEEMRAAWEANRFTYDWAFEDAYIPDLQNPDPLVALEELITLTEWLAEHGGSDLWWDVLAVSESPAFEFWRSTLRRIDGDLYLDREGGKRFAVTEARTASDDEILLIPQSVREGAPPGSQFLVYSGADTDGGVRIFAPTGEEVDQYDPFEVVDRAVVLSPTTGGWAFYWGAW